MNFTVAAFYKFVELPDYEALRLPLVEQCESLMVCGTILLAAEGINGTVAASPQAIEQLFAYLRSDERLSDLTYKISHTDEAPFHRMKVRLKKEIVSMGVPDCKPAQLSGVHVSPKEWNQLITDPEVIVIDTRNDYEVDIGTFKGAINPNTESFREFPEYVQKQLAENKQQKIAMFCTGGIRCEKASSYLIEQGFENVYQLSGGILQYLEDVPVSESQWQGECFVFDDRVSVDHDLLQGQYDLCHACRHPITDEDMTSPHYQPGASCPNCYDKISEEKRKGAAERHKQVQLAKQRGEQHIGRKFD